MQARDGVRVAPHQHGLGIRDRRLGCFGFTRWYAASVTILIEPKTTDLTRKRDGSFVCQLDRSFSWIGCCELPFLLGCFCLAVDA
jgi:hypothetical protein